MRRTLQRCTASAPRIRSSISSCRASYIETLTREGVWQHQNRLSRIAVRQLHQSRSRLEEAAAQTKPFERNEVITRFDELAAKGIIHPNVIRAITSDMGLDTMTEVQTKTINEALGGADIIAQARTGTGKTLAFLLPILQNIISLDPDLAQPSMSRYDKRTTADDIRAIIISPTRELAEQIAVEAKKLVRHTGLVVQTAVGGTHKREGLAMIQRQGCHILVGTPGRLKDILSDPRTRVEAPDLSAFVLDEADRLLDQGFWPEISEIQRLLPTPTEKDRQTLMFSATIPTEVVDLVRSTLKPGFHYVKCVREDEVPTHERVNQRLVTVNGMENHIPALVELCRKATAASRAGEKPFKAIVYFNSTAEVTFASSVLQSLQESDSRQSPLAPARVYTIHAKLTQAQRTRSADNFRHSASAILVSSDVTARGMDFPNVTHVVQIGLATSRDQYIHRIGRTGRAGREGTGWLFLSPLEIPEARKRLYDLPIQPDTSLETAKIDLTREAQVPVEAGRILSMYQQAMRGIPTPEKNAVYKAMIGIFTWISDKTRLVEQMNNLAKYGWGMAEPPKVAPGLVMRLGMSRIPGLNIGHEDDYESPRAGGFGGRDAGRGGYRGRSFGDAFDNRSSSRGGGDPFAGTSGYGGSRGGNSDPFGTYVGTRPGYGEYRGGGDRTRGRDGYERSGGRGPERRASF